MPLRYHQTCSFSPSSYRAMIGTARAWRSTLVTSAPQNNKSFANALRARFVAPADLSACRWRRYTGNALCRCAARLTLLCSRRLSRRSRMPSITFAATTRTGRVPVRTGVWPRAVIQRTVCERITEREHVAIRAQNTTRNLCARLALLAVSRTALFLWRFMWLTAQSRLRAAPRATNAKGCPPKTRISAIAADNCR